MAKFELSVRVSVVLDFDDKVAAWEWLHAHTVGDLLDCGAIVGDELC